MGEGLERKKLKMNIILYYHKILNVSIVFLNSEYIVAVGIQSFDSKKWEFFPIVKILQFYFQIFPILGGVQQKLGQKWEKTT